MSIERVSGKERPAEAAGGRGKERLSGLEERLIGRLRQAGARGLGRREVGSAAGEGESEEAVDRALERLRAQGLAAPWRERWSAAEAAGWLQGTVERALSAGGAAVQAGDEPMVVGSDALAGAKPGDRVLVRPFRGRRRLVAGKNLQEAAVVAVLGRTPEPAPARPEKRAADRPRRQSPQPPREAVQEPQPPSTSSIVGAVAFEDGEPWIAPYDSREPDLDLDGADGVPEGHFVIAEPVRRPTGRPAERARVVEVLGDPEQPGIDTEVVLRHYRIPTNYPEAALAEAEALPDEPRADDVAGRLDLRDRTVITIDGTDARDFDDALSVEPLGDGWRLGVHIADVGHYVAEGGALDREAARRGTSVYFPGRVVPMLPEALSNGLCSLRPGVPRLTMSAFLDVGRDGRVRRRRFAESVIASARRLTYEEVRRVIEEERPKDAREYGPVLPLLAELRELMAALHRRRRERGSLDFDLPEGDVELDTDGYTVGVQPGRRTVAHRIVEETMIAANEAVAAELEDARVPALYRVHLAPAPDDLDVLLDALERLGLEPPEGGEEVMPADLAAVQEAAEGEPWEGFVNSLVMRTLKGAFYGHENRGHFALASERYTHFTSPIRRYPDLVVHRRLKTLLREGARAARAGGSELEAVAAAASEAERRATRAERDVLQWKKVRFLAGRVGETFPGRITGVQKYGLFVQLDRYLVDGLVPVRTLGREYFRFDPEGHRLVGEESGRAFRLADPVTVELVGVSEEHRGLDLALAD